MTKKIVYPTFTRRNGSKCYYTMDGKFFEGNKKKCLRMVAFYTLYLFGHQENNKNLMVISAHDIHERTLRWCLKMIYKNKLRHRVFHMPAESERKLMNAFGGKILVTNEVINGHKNGDEDNDGGNKMGCKTNRKHDTFPSMWDIFHVKVYTQEHEVGDDDYADDNDGYMYNGRSFLLGEQTSEWNTCCDPAGGIGRCLFCDLVDDNKINQSNFTFENNDDVVDNHDSSSKNSDNSNDDINSNDDSDTDNRCKRTEKEINEILKDTTTETITMNNLVFNFRDYQFDLKLNGNKCHITFNPKAIGGYRHASIYTGAAFEVHHAIPGTLEHYQTTYVNEINISVSEHDDEMVIMSEYKAIDVL